MLTPFVGPHGTATDLFVYKAGDIVSETIQVMMMTMMMMMMTTRRRGGGEEEGSSSS
jgi:hypothetical protein